jgi:nucleoside-diphosphate-sugar epimerase
VIHADDLVRLLILAAERGRRLPPWRLHEQQSGEGRYFAACEQDPTYAELGRLIAKSAGHRVLVIPALMPLVYAAAAAAEAVSQFRQEATPLNFDKAREIAAGSWLCSAQAARNELGFDVAAPLIERLRQTVQWYRQHNWL